MNFNKIYIKITNYQIKNSKYFIGTILLIYYFETKDQLKFVEVLYGTTLILLKLRFC